MKNKADIQREEIAHPLGTKVYTTEQVAAELQLSVRHIYRAIKSGQLKAKKTGKQYLITQEAVQAYWDQIPDAPLDT